MLKISNISKSYKDGTTQQIILNKLSFSIAAGNSVSIQGASGSGKSTLLHLLAALDKPDEGEIILSASSDADQNVNICKFSESQADDYRMSTVGIVFQKYNLIDVVSVVDNIYLPVKLNAIKGQAIDKSYIDYLITALGIETQLHKLPNQLSGGEQQRVAIARALAHKPKLLLADEPTGNLDSHNSDVVSRLLVDTCSQLNMTLVLVTHSEKVAHLCSQQVFLSQGRLIGEVG